MKIQIITIVICFGMLFTKTNAQSVSISPEHTSGTCSDYVVTFDGIASSVATSFNFNGGTLPSGWSTSPFTISSTICSNHPTPDNSNYFWATSLGTASPYVGKRYVQTNAVDVSSGGTISFYLLYGDGIDTDCEQPDLSDEEVWLQYSTNGSTWTTIYDGWETSSSNAYDWYEWYHVSLSVPAGAQTSGTYFRWYQPSNSGDCCDNWGLEDISIGTNITPTGYKWYVNGTQVATTEDLTYTFSATGTYTVKFETSFSNGSTKSSTISYEVIENQTPTLNSISDLTVQMNSGQQTVSLSGISDGDCVSQTISLSTASGDTAIIGNPTYSYTSPNSTGSLYFTPVTDTFGTVQLTATITDNGANAYGTGKNISRNFNVYVNDYPTDPGAFVLPAPTGNRMNIDYDYDIQWGASTDQTAGVSYYLEYMLNGGSWSSVAAGTSATSVADWGGHKNVSLVDRTVQFRVRSYDGTYFSQQYVYSPVYTIVENTPPVAVDDGTYSVNTGASYTGNVLANDTDVDNDDLEVTVQPTLSQGSFTSFNLETGAFVYSAPTNWAGSFTFNYTVTDGMEQDVGTATFTVVDTIVPVVLVKDTTVYLNASGMVTIDSSYIDNGSTDNIGVTRLTLDTFMFDCDNVGDILVELTAFDEAGNSSKDTATVTVLDSTAPIVEAHDTVLYLNSEGLAYLTAASVDDGSTDNCSIDTMYLSRYIFDCDDIGVETTPPAPPALVGDLKSAAGAEPSIPEYGVVVTLTVADGIPNKDSAHFYVTVLDTFAPLVQCRDTTISLDAEGTVTIDTSFVYLGSSDACGIASISLSQSTFDGSHVNYNSGTIAVDVLVADINGNVGTCISNITIMDTIAPEARCQDIGITLDTAGTARIYHGFIDNGSTDAGGIVSYVLDINKFYCSDIGENTVVMSVKDVGGNVSTCSAVVTIADNWLPEITCKDLEVSLGTTGVAVIDSSMITDAASSICGIATIEVSQSEFTSAHLGDNTVTLTVTNLSGISSTCESTVTVKDEIYPVANCNSIDVWLANDGTYTLSANDIAMVADSSSDNASVFDNLQIVVTPDTFDCSDVGDSVAVTVSITDEAGNESTCETWVYVRDSMELFPASFNDVEVSLAAGSCDSLTAIDYPEMNISSCATLTQLEGLGADSLFPVGTTVETWELDYNSVKDTFSFSVIVSVENAVPTIDTIANVTASEDDTPISIALSGISGGNDCTTQNVTVTASNTNGTLLTDLEVDYTAGDTVGVLTLTLAANQSGTDNISVTVEDSEGGKTSTTFKLTVDPVNDAPYLLLPLSDETVNASKTFELPLTELMGVVFDDIDDDTLAFDVMLEGTDTLPSWAVIEDGVLIAIPMIADMGTYWFVVTATDTSGAMASDTFKLEVEGYPTAIDDMGKGVFELTMYPNPTKGLVTVETSATQTAEIEIAVMNIAGAEVFRKEYRSGDLIRFDMSEEVSGIYLVLIEVDGERVVKKLILDRK